MNSLMNFGTPAEISKMLNRVYSVDISESFVNCANNQLSALFEKLPELNLNQGIWMGWAEESPFIYETGPIPKIKATIFFRYGNLAVEILWKSKTGYIYDPSACNIKCEDIEFCFEGLDSETCKNLMSPKWSLLTFKDSCIKDLKRIYNLDVSHEFLECADKQLSASFENLLGIKFNKEISLELVKSPYDADFLEALKARRFLSTLYLYHNWNPITIVWESKTGHNYSIEDRNIDCKDINFRFDQFDIDKFLKQLPTKRQLPFSLKNLSFELNTYIINVECSIFMQLREEFHQEKDRVIEKLYKFVGDFNAASELENRQNGVVHNSRAVIVNENTIEFQVHLGSGGIFFLKKLLASMSKMECFHKVEIGP